MTPIISQKDEPRAPSLALYSERTQTRCHSILPKPICRLTLTLADFDLLRRIGDGSFSQVVLARHKSTETEYALKVIDKQHVLRHNAIEQVRRERNILDKLDYEGIAKLHFTFQDAISLYMGLEHCPEGELYDQIRLKHTLDIETVRFYAAEIVLMLEYLQSNRIVHRDLKPENLMLMSDGHLKLIDFGSAKEVPVLIQKDADTLHCDDCIESADEAKDCSGSFGQEVSRNSTCNTNIDDTLIEKEEENSDDKFDEKHKRTVSLVGTADYVSPEVLHNQAITCAADLWALGCVIYHMITGRAPFRSESEYLTFQKILSLEYSPLPENIPSDARDLVDKLLVLDPDKRLGAASMDDLKGHPFFDGIDWNSVRTRPAPELVKVETESLGSTESSFDWELQSLAAALPRFVGGADARTSIEFDED